MVRHATKVDSCAFLALVHHFLYVDRTELVFDTFRLTFGKWSTRSYHIDTYILVLFTYNV